MKGKCRKLLEDEDGMRNYFLNKSLTAQTVEAKMGEKVKIPQGENLEVIFYIPRVGKKFKSTTKQVFASMWRNGTSIHCW